MIKQETIDLVNDVFAIILNAQSIKDIEAKLKDKAFDKYRIDDKKYPDIKFIIKKGEIAVIKKYLKNNSIGQDATPLEKFFYAALWKNGDLQKVKHICDGLLFKNNSILAEKKDTALVFYQFGKFIQKPSEEPIIDQHILRAFALYNLPQAKYKIKVGNGKSKKNKALTKNDLIKNQLLSTASESRKNFALLLITDYKKWIGELEIVKSASGAAEKKRILRSIDKLLFALGKRIKRKHK